MQKHAEMYFVCVIEEEATRRIVASGTLVVEQKFIRQCGKVQPLFDCLRKVGHIEDIVVHDSQRGKNFGRLYDRFVSSMPMLIEQHH